jgi:hypothetical protein
MSAGTAKTVQRRMQRFALEEPVQQIAKLKQKGQAIGVENGH